MAVMHADGTPDVAGSVQLRCVVHDCWPMPCLLSRQDDLHRRLANRVMDIIAPCFDCYPIQQLLAHRVASSAESRLVLHRFGERILGTAQWSFLQTSPRVAHIYGTKGSITVERVNCPERITVATHGSAPKVGCGVLRCNEVGCVCTLRLLTQLANMCDAGF